MKQPLIYKYLEAMHRLKATDLYLTVGYPPCLRIETDFKNIAEEPVDQAQINEILVSITTSRQLRDFEATMELNMPIHLGEMGRFRVNVLKQRQMPALVIRRISSKIPGFNDLNQHPTVENLAGERQGLILITGMTGSGKSTTLASMIDYRNERMRGHIITIEDPIEYFHEHKMSVVTQREVGVDTVSYAAAMKNAFRQRPDVILVGEILDREVMEQALIFSQTGHVCMATIHANNAYQAIDRVINLFDKDFQDQARLSLASNLRAVISQRLIPGVNGNLIMAQEILLNEGLVRKLIREGETGGIREIMSKNSNSGMCTFDESILSLYQKGLIEEEVAIRQSDQPGEMRMKIKQTEIGKVGSMTTIDTSRISMSENE